MICVKCDAVASLSNPRCKRGLWGYLRVAIGQKDPSIEWVVVRPDSLLDHDNMTAYEAFPSPTRSAIFNAGKTSRINVGHFMATLITNDEVWRKWKGQMPVVYNVGDGAS